MVFPCPLADVDVAEFLSARAALVGDGADDLARLDLVPPPDRDAVADQRPGRTAASSTPTARPTVVAVPVLPTARAAVIPAPTRTAVVESPCRTDRLGLEQHRLVALEHDRQRGCDVYLGNVVLVDVVPDDVPEGVDPIPVFFGEDQGRYLVTVDSGDTADRLRERGLVLGVNAAAIGWTGGDTLTLGAARPVPVEELKTANEGWFPRYMAGEL